jgi:2-acylglycerol O-acyltransferase 2
LLNGRDYRILTVDANFQIPLGRDMLMALGFVDASPESMRFCLRQKNVSIVVVVGGANEAGDSRPRTFDLTLDKRLGFVRVALQSGAQGIVPVLSFGYVYQRIQRILVTNLMLYHTEKLMHLIK